MTNSGNLGHQIHVSVVCSVQQQGASQNTKINCLFYQENIQVLNVLNVNGKQGLIECFVGFSFFRNITYQLKN